jgi:hypothetical protein
MALDQVDATCPKCGSVAPRAAQFCPTVALPCPPRRPLTHRTYRRSQVGGAKIPGWRSGTTRKEGIAICLYGASGALIVLGLVWPLRAPAWARGTCGGRPRLQSLESTALPIASGPTFDDRGSDCAAYEATYLRHALDSIGYAAAPQQPAWPPRGWLAGIVRLPGVKSISSRIRPD